jgi:hypothetical protein
MNDRRLAALLFPIRGVEGDKFVFRFLRIRENLPDDNQLPIRMQRWASRLWRKELRCPVYPTSVDAARGFLVPADAVGRPGFPSKITLTDVPDRDYTLEVTDRISEITIQQAGHSERDLICRMLERPFTDVLLSRKSQFWKAEWTLFFPLKSVNENVKQEVINAYRGFKFGVVLLGDAPYLAIDVRTRYIGRKPLSDFSPQERETTLRDHLDRTLKLDERASFLRDNGPRKIPCRYAGETGKSISDYEFEAGRTVASYHAQQYRLNLDPNDPAVFVKDRTGEGSPLAVPACRLFPVFTTEFEGVRFCSVKPWINPAERSRLATQFLANLSGAQFGNRALTVIPKIFTAKRTVFPPPKLEFGQGRILEPFHGLPPRPEEEAFDGQIVRWGSRKYPMLLQSGPQQNEPLPDLVLLYPDQLPRDVRETFVRDISKEISLQTGQGIRVVQHLPYSTGKQEKMGGALLRRIPEIKSLPNRHLALVILSDNFDSSVHGELKDRIRPVLSQCVTESTVYNVAKQRNPNRARSQVRNLGLAILTEAGVKPWVLADALYHDVHIGIDLLYGRVAYHSFYGHGGRVMASSFGEVQQRGRMQEAIKAPLIQPKIEQLLHDMANDGHQLKRLIIHRDGRWWPSEARGFRNAIARLKKQGVLPIDASWAVIEVRKNHMPVRLFTISGKETAELLQNPLPGTYLVLDDRRVLLTTTGRPGAWDVANGRTAGTLLLQVADFAGDLNLSAIAEDAYRLTQLNWTSPDIEISLPVTIRWADEALRETLRNVVAADEEDEFSGEMLEDSEATGEAEA